MVVILILEDKIQKGLYVFVIRWVISNVIVGNGWIRVQKLGLPMLHLLMEGSWKNDTYEMFIPTTVDVFAEFQLYKEPTKSSSTSITTFSKQVNV